MLFSKKSKQSYVYVHIWSYIWYIFLSRACRRPACRLRVRILLFLDASKGPPFRTSPRSRAPKRDLSSSDRCCRPKGGNYYVSSSPQLLLFSRHQHRKTASNVLNEPLQTSSLSWETAYPERSDWVRSTSLRAKTTLSTNVFPCFHLFSIAAAKTCTVLFYEFFSKRIQEVVDHKRLQRPKRIRLVFLLVLIFFFHSVPLSRERSVLRAFFLYVQHDYVTLFRLRLAS